MTNPVPYFAPYSGFKTHLNQNEKIVLMIDGCSRLIVGYTSTPIKNPILIYEYAFHPAVLKYGVWEQVRIGHGRKFAYSSNRCSCVIVKRGESNPLSKFVPQKTMLLNACGQRLTKQLIIR